MKNYLKIFFAFLILLLNLSVAEAKSEGITIISDVHLSMDKKENKMTPSIRKLLLAVEQANVDTSDCVVFLGDNVNSADRYDITMFSKIIKKLKKPYFVTIGDKDIGKTRGVTKKEYFRLLNKYSNSKTTKLPTYKKHNDFVFVFLSGVNETFSTNKGYYKTQDLSFLEKTLNKFDDKKIIIFQHFPIVAPYESEMKQTVKPELYLDLISKHNNVLAIISGHYEKENITELNGIKHISVGSLSKDNEYEQIKIFKNKDNSYTITTKILNVE